MALVNGDHAPVSSTRLSMHTITLNGTLNSMFSIIKCLNELF